MISRWISQHEASEATAPLSKPRGHRRTRAKPQRILLALFPFILAAYSILSVDQAFAAIFTVRDNFTTVSYSNNDGTVNWSGDWQELNDDGSPVFDPNQAMGISDGQLYVRRIASGLTVIYRDANLSGATSATFSFDYTTVNLEDGDVLRVAVSPDGGSSWVVLEALEGAGSGSRSYDITAFMGSITRVAFYPSLGLDFGEYFIFDNVEIAFDIPGVPTPFGDVTSQDISFPNITLNGLDQAQNGSTTAWTVESTYPAGTGWHVTIQGADYSDGSHSIDIGNMSARLLDSNIVVISGSAPPSSTMTSYTPLSTTAQTMLQAEGDAGVGVYEFTPDFRLAVPAEAYAGSYTATITATFVVGP